MVGNIGIVTDSGTDWPDSFAGSGKVVVAPLSVHIDGVEYKDGVDISKPEFYSKLREGVRKIHTAQPSPGDFVKAYEKVAAEADEVLCITLSSRLSGTYQSAVMAAELVGIDVTVFDSLSASVGTGLMVARALEMIKQGRSREDVLQELSRVRDNMQSVFVVDTLEYLERNGRIGRAAALVGSILRIKPLLTIQEGIVAPFEKVRGRAKAFRRMVDYVAQRARGPVAAAIAHADAPQAAAQLKKELARLPVEFTQLVTACMGPTIGVHTGPGLVGMAFYAVSP